MKALPWWTAVLLATAAAAAGEHRSSLLAPNPRSVDTRPLWPQQTAILSLSIFPVKLLSVDEGPPLQGSRARKLAGHTRSLVLFPPPQHRDEEAIGAVTRRGEEERGVAAVGR